MNSTGGIKMSVNKNQPIKYLPKKDLSKLFFSWSIVIIVICGLLSVFM